IEGVSPRNGIRTGGPNERLRQPAHMGGGAQARITASLVAGPPQRLVQPTLRTSQRLPTYGVEKCSRYDELLHARERLLDELPRGLRQLVGQIPAYSAAFFLSENSSVNTFSIRFRKTVSKTFPCTTRTSVSSTGNGDFKDGSN